MVTILALIINHDVWINHHVEEQFNIEIQTILTLNVRFFSWELQVKLQGAI